MVRPRHGEPLCTGTWPLTGNPCRDAARPGLGTCAAHDPAGDQRPAPPTDDARCPGLVKSSGERCRQPLPPGWKTCRSHGGNAPQSRRAAAARAAETRAAALVATYGRKIETSATQALIDEVQWTAGHVEWLRAKIQEIEEAHAVVLDEGDGGVPADRDRNPLIWGITKIKYGGEDQGTTFEAAPSIWLSLYWRERDHLVRVCAATVKAGVNERLVLLAEDQGRLVADVLRRILGDLNLTAEQQIRAREVAPRHLRALSG